MMSHPLFWVHQGFLCYSSDFLISSSSSSSSCWHCDCEHVSMPMLAFSSRHCFAQVQPHSAWKTLTQTFSSILETWYETNCMRNASLLWYNYLSSTTYKVSLWVCSTAVCDFGHSVCLYLQIWSIVHIRKYPIWAISMLKTNCFILVQALICRQSSV